MQGINEVTLLGNLGQDPEYNATGPLARMNLATSERYKGQDGEWKEVTTWHRVIAWRWLAKLVNEEARKGSTVLVRGSIQSRSYDDKDGNKRYVTEVNASYIRIFNTSADAHTS